MRKIKIKGVTSEEAERMISQFYSDNICHNDKATVELQSGKILKFTVRSVWDSDDKDFVITPDG